MNTYQDTLYNTGKLFTLSRNVRQGKGSFIAHDFLFEWAVGFAREAKKYIDKIEEPPFIYGERQLTASLIPALAKITHVFLTEMPVSRKRPNIKDRKKSDYKYLGWVDFWANYKDYDFYIELKHDYDAYNSYKIRKSVFQNWRVMNEKQLPDLEDDAKYLSADKKAAYTISLHVITIYKYWQKKYGDNVIVQESDLIEIQKRYFHQFKEANWCGLWSLHPKLVENSYWEYDNHYETHPGVIFLSKIKRIL